MMLLSITAVLGLPLFTSRAQNAPLAPVKADADKPDEAIDVVLKQRRERVRELEVKLDAMLEEDRRRNADPSDDPATAVAKAELAYQKAKRERELAELAVIEYTDGIYVQDHESAQADIKMARSELGRAADRLAFSKALYEKEASKTPDGKDLQIGDENDMKNRLAAGKPLSPLELSYVKYMSDSLGHLKAEFGLEQAETKLKLLTDFTKQKNLKELQSKVEKAKSEELAKQALIAEERMKPRRNQRLKQEYEATSMEDLAIALTDDAVKREERVAALLAEAKQLADRIAAEPKDAKALTEKMEAKRAEAKKLAGEASSRMFEAAALSRSVSANWAKLLAARKELKQARTSLEIMERIAEKLERRK